MKEYSIIKSIFNTRYICPDLVMEEDDDQTKAVQKVEITSYSRSRNQQIVNSEMTLYRFDEKNDGDFLPFFENKKGQTPTDLRLFADYILIANVQQSGTEILYLYIFELKRTTGDNTHARKQLASTKLFVDYVLDTAVRINKDFDKKSVVVMQVIVQAVVKRNKGKLKFDENDSVRIVQLKYTDSVNPLYVAGMFVE